MPIVTLKSFVSSFINENPNTLVPHTDYNYNGGILDAIGITEEVVWKVLVNLNVNKSAGIDGITPHLLKNVTVPQLNQ